VNFSIIFLIVATSFAMEFDTGEAFFQQIFISILLIKNRKFV
jgi:hypothetical protein